VKGEWDSAAQKLNS